MPMLYSLEFANSNSFRDLQDFNLSRPPREARRSEKRWPESSWDHLVSPVAAIFGANAAGKSGLIRALWMALKNPIYGDEVAIAPFRLRRNPDSEPVTFDIRFRARDFASEARECEYHYRFETSPSGTILLEELRYFPRDASKSQRVFRREISPELIDGKGPSYDYRWGFKGEKAFAVRLTSSNELFLGNTRSLENNPLAPVLSWLDDNVNFYSATGYETALPSVKKRLHESPEFLRKVANYVSHADLGVIGLEVIARSENETAAFRRSLEGQDIPQQVLDRAIEDFALELRFTHGTPTDSFSFAEDLESDGTRAMLAFSTIAIDALESGSVLIIDEIDTSLHPLLVRELVRQFASPETNPLQAQLIFTTHDATLLQSPSWMDPLLERDQIWLVEKNPDGSSNLYSVAEFPVRNDENIFRKYLAGQYGSIPRPDLSPLDGK